MSVSQQSGVLDQQLRKLLSSPGLPAVSPIALPLLSAHGEGRGAICCFPNLHTTIPYRTLRSIAEATRVGFFSAVALHKNVRHFLRAGRKGCTKMKSPFHEFDGYRICMALSMLWLVCKFGTKTSNKLFILNLSQHYSDECILNTLTPASALVEETDANR